MLSCHLYLMSFFFYLSADHRDLHSFPTRRSSDLEPRSRAQFSSSIPPRRFWVPEYTAERHTDVVGHPKPPWRNRRSEEHTSELQSHSDLVCRLLLEKKKKNNK